MPRTATARKPSRTASVKLEVHASRFTFTKLPTGHVTVDNKTGLAWSHTLGRATFTKAQALVDKLNADKHCGHADWRMPTVEELFCLADRTRSSPAIDTDAFPDTESDWYWTGTKYAPYSGFAWFVSFHNGYSSSVPLGNAYFVRAVRASQS